MLGQYHAGDAIMRITITVKNLDSVTRRIDGLERMDYLKGVASAGADVLRADLRKYPPKPPDSTYRRTGTLGKSWTKSVMRGGREGGWLAQIGTRLGYAPYVQDELRQAKVHQGRWQTVQSVAKDRRDEVVRFVVRAIGGWLRKG